METETDTRTATVWQGIVSDAEYFGRFTRDLTSSSNETLTSIAAFCMVPYFSLAMHESLRKIESIDPNISSSFTSEALEISTRSRHSLKLFEDTMRGIEGQLSYFRDEILSAHSERFLDGSRISLSQPFKTDLGLCNYKDRLITTTHAATFHLGIDPKRLLADGSGPYIRDIFEEYGAFFGSLGASLEDQGADTFFKSLRASELRENNVRAAKYYRKVFNGSDTSEINAALTTFRAMLNFADLVLTSAADRQHLEYTEFKIAYLSLYQVLHSVRILLGDATYNLTKRSAQIASGLVNTEAAQAIMQRSAKPFRNTLMHYNLPPRVEISRVDLSQPIFGLIPIYFPQHNVATFLEMLKQCGSTSAAMFDQWAEERR